MKHTASIRILITLPPHLKHYLDDLRRLESRTASGHIQYLLREDRRCRTESGWQPKDGWKHRESPAYQQYVQAGQARAKTGIDRLILKAAKRIEKANSTRPRRVSRTPR